MDPVIDLNIFQVLLAYIFIVFLLIIVKTRGINREKEILISSFRMTIQLIIAGYVLVYIFDNESPVITIFIILLMQTFSIYTVFKRFKGRLSKKLKKVIALSISSGTLICLLYFLFVVIRITPWYNPQYFIPIAGMLIGNSMASISLGINHLINSMTKEKAIIEEALVLGATPNIATKQIINNAFDIAIMPTINSMVGMGIVFLPGMMTGQILAGVSPITAISYQIAIMLGILGAVSITVILLLQLGYKTFFNKQEQII